MASFEHKAFDEGWVVASVGDDDFVVVTLVYSDGTAFSYSSHPRAADKLPEPFPTPLDLDELVAWGHRRLKEAQ